MNVTVLILALLVTPAQNLDSDKQDQLFTKDGSILTGTIIQLEKDTYRMTIEGIGEISIPADRVSKIQFKNLATLITDAGVSIEGTWNLSEDGSWSVDNEIIEATLPGNRVTAINPTPLKPPTSSQKATFSLNGSKTSGNTNTTSAVMNVDYKFRYLTHRFVSKIDWAYAEDNDVVSKRSTGADMKYDFFPEEDWFLYTNFAARNDGFAGLSLRTTAGVGAGLQVLDREDLTWSEEAGISALNEDFKTAADESTSTLRIAGNAEWVLGEDRLTLFHDHTIYLSIEDTDDVIAESRLGLRTKIVGGLNMNTQINFRYDSQPPAGFQEDDFEFLVGLGNSKSF